MSVWWEKRVCLGRTDGFTSHLHAANDLRLERWKRATRKSGCVTEEETVSFQVTIGSLPESIQLSRPVFLKRQPTPSTSFRYPDSQSAIPYAQSWSPAAFDAGTAGAQSSPYLGNSAQCELFQIPMRLNLDAWSSD